MEIIPPIKRSRGSYYELEEAIDNLDEIAIKRLLNSHRHLTITTPDIYKWFYRVYQSVNFRRERQPVIIDILKALIDGGVNINVSDKEGHTALHLAVKYRMKKVFDWLIRRGANVNLRDKFGNSLIQYYIAMEFNRMLAPETSQIDINKKKLLDFESENFIKSMVFKGLDVGCTNNNGDTALQMAIDYYLLYAIPSLLEHTKYVTIVNKSNLTALQSFAKSVDRFLIENKRQLSDMKYFPTYQNEGEHVDNIYKKFISKGFIVNIIDEKGSTPLHYILKQALINRGNIIINSLKGIMERFANVKAQDDNGDTVLHIIMRYPSNHVLVSKNHECYEKYVKTLLSKGADVNQENNHGTSAVLIAVTNLNLRLLKLFIVYGADLRYQYKNGNLLHYLFRSKKKLDGKIFQSVFEILIKGGCNVNGKDAKGKTPLHISAQGKVNTDIMKVLIELGADVNCKDIIGKTPLHDAAGYGLEDQIEVLIDNGADITARSNDGQTVLHWFNSEISRGSNHALNGNLPTRAYIVPLIDKSKIIEKLVKLGCPVDVTDNTGWLPLHKAILRRNTSVINELLKLGANINDNAHILKLENYYYEPIYDHFMKLYYAEMPIDETLKYSVQIYYYTYFIRDKSLKDIEGMKNYNISDTKSLYDFLHMDHNRKCSFVNNKTLMELVKSPDFEKQFPMYNLLISSFYNQAVERRKLLESVKESWYELIGIQLPELCLHEILSYLSNVSLRVMTEL